jgi:hypothetical protein
MRNQSGCARSALWCRVSFYGEMTLAVTAATLVVNKGWYSPAGFCNHYAHAMPVDEVDLLFVELGGARRRNTGKSDEAAGSELCSYVELMAGGTCCELIAHSSPLDSPVRRARRAAGATTLQDRDLREYARSRERRAPQRDDDVHRRVAMPDTQPTSNFSPPRQPASDSRCEIGRVDAEITSGIGQFM